MYVGWAGAGEATDEAGPIVQVLLMLWWTERFFKKIFCFVFAQKYFMSVGTRSLALLSLPLSVSLVTYAITLISDKEFTLGDQKNVHITSSLFL